CRKSYNCNSLIQRHGYLAEAERGQPWRVYPWPVFIPHDRHRPATRVTGERTRELATDSQPSSSFWTGVGTFTIFIWLTKGSGNRSAFAVRFTISAAVAASDEAVATDSSKPAKKEITVKITLQVPTAYGKPRPSDWD